MKLFAYLAACLLLVIPLAGCGGGTDDEIDAVSIEVENLRLVRQRDGSRAVRGVVLNHAGEPRSVQVIIALYDASNQRIGEVQVPVENVAASGQQGFSSTLDLDAAGVSVRRIIGY